MGKASKYPAYSSGSISVNGQTKATAQRDSKGNLVSSNYNMSDSEKNIYNSVQDNLYSSLGNLFTITDSDKQAWNSQLNAMKSKGLQTIDETYTPMETNLKNDIASRFGNYDNSVFLNNLNTITNKKAQAYADLSNNLLTEQNNLYSEELQNRINTITLLSNLNTALNDNILNYTNMANSNAESGNSYNNNAYNGNYRASTSWVSMDGVGEYHDKVRGEGTFARLEQNIATCGCRHLSVNMAINTLNCDSVAAAIEYASKSRYLESISLNFHTPFPGTEALEVPHEKRVEIINMILDYKKRGYPIMNSTAGLRKMKDNDFVMRCWISNFVFVDGTRSPQCIGAEMGICPKCGFCMAGEESAVFELRPGTILAALKLRK